MFQDTLPKNTQKDVIRCKALVNGVVYLYHQNGYVTIIARHIDSKVYRRKTQC